jgi:hypothetical protein
MQLQEQEKSAQVGEDGEREWRDAEEAILTIVMAETIGGKDLLIVAKFSKINLFSETVGPKNY